MAPSSSDSVSFSDSESLSCDLIAFNSHFVSFSTASVALPVVVVTSSRSAARRFRYGARAASRFCSCAEAMPESYTLSASDLLASVCSIAAARCALARAIVES